MPAIPAAIGFAQQADQGRVERKFFKGFAQCGCGRVLTLVNPSARECDLSGMSAQIVASLGQDQSGLRAVCDGDQDRRLPGFALMSFDKIAGQQSMRRIAGKSRRDSFDQAHGESRKNMPSDQTPGGTWPSASAISANS